MTPHVLAAISATMSGVAATSAAGSGRGATAAAPQAMVLTMAATGLRVAQPHGGATSDGEDLVVRFGVMGLDDPGSLCNRAPADEPVAGASARVSSAPEGSDDESPLLPSLLARGAGMSDSLGPSDRAEAPRAEAVASGPRADILAVPVPLIFLTAGAVAASPGNASATPGAN